ncbi:hypothetical protein BCR33DRAFT_764680 [Rhizoclosmatium globosum]|uniref:Uncharacterized protein n=1 Tax=Rhizoclosmatium globosum TaxID=329046 RepID=A0A1Y2CL44_9FUNG|nr:hypothetical protein BCR33DRAFT_764680 [Rhizoclosmatium globosum]|eukprot:ORY47045.1 hypothetical protein BCR33DRAFT_764680 [Rhizoclosmatium globosum]
MDYICGRPFTWHYSVNQTLDVAQYLNHGLPQSLSIDNDCKDIVGFVVSPLNQRTSDWFSHQNIKKQRALITNICADFSQSTQTLEVVFFKLNHTLTLDAILQKTITDCLYMRDGGIEQVYYNFAGWPTDDLVLTWYASRNIWTQLDIIDFLLSGWILEFGSRYTINDVVNIVEVYINFTDYLGLPTSLASSEVSNYLDWYNSTDRLSVDATGGFNVLWFNSQNTSLQIRAIQIFCNDPSFSPSDAYNLVKLIWPNIIDTSVRQEIQSCPKVTRDHRFDFYIEFFVFLGFVFVDGGMIIAFTYLVWKYDNTQETKRILTPFNIGFVISILSLLGTNIIYMCYWKLYLSLRILDDSTVIEEGFYYILSYLFPAAWKFSYLYVSYIRSKTLLKRVWPRWADLIGILCYLSAIPFILPIIFSIPEFIHIPGFTPTRTWAVQTASEIMLLLLDMILLTAFVKYVTRINIDAGDSKSDHFDAIPHYGSAASGACLLLCIVALTRPLIEAYLPERADLLTGSITVTVGLMHVVSGILLLMKWRLVSRREWSSHPGAGTVEKRTAGVSGANSTKQMINSRKSTQPETMNGMQSQSEIHSFNIVPSHILIS